MEKNNTADKRYIFIIGAKSVGQYGGYEVFVDRLTERHEGLDALHYCLVTKANGEGAADANTPPTIHGADMIRLPVPSIGPAQAIAYDARAWKYCLQYAKEHRLRRPIFYILGCRRWLTFPLSVKKAHRLGGVVLVNPDGLEWKRAKWSAPVRLYLKQCERAMVRSCDLVVCDSQHIQGYICKSHPICAPRTRYIAYGADPSPSALADDSPAFLSWLQAHGISPQGYYLCCGRLVPENNFEIILREFMKSDSKKPLVLITTKNDRFLKKLEKRLRFADDPRIRFADPVYDRELLKKIRENAFAGIHGHSVGGTNPNLLEALASTCVNLVFDVCFNREAAQNAALYWSMEEGSLSRKIGEAEAMSSQTRTALGQMAKERIRTAYGWDRIAAQYEKLFTEADGAARREV